VDGQAVSREPAISLNRTHWTHTGALVLLPWVFILIDDSWLYSPPGTIDPWV
jgi:hypothetical protein